jgi:hypothetical protein
MGQHNTKLKHEIKSCDMLARCILGAYLLSEKRDDIVTNYDYESFNGTKLPSPSGYNEFYSVFTYMLRGNYLDSKIDAIEKYINEQILCDENTTNLFLQKFLEKIKTER